MSKIYPELFKLYFDGCSKGNPGHAGIGAVIYSNNEEMWSGCKFIGHKTNNESEYSALIFGLEEALKLGISDLLVYGDSLLVINQMTKKYQVKSESLYVLNLRANELIKLLKSVSFNHVYRNENKRADELSNIALHVSIEDNLVSNKLKHSFLPEIKKA